jgi:hypothetical protein
MGVFLLNLNFSKMDPIVPPKKAHKFFAKKFA